MRSQPSNTAGSGWAFLTLARGQWKVFRYSAGVCEVVLLTWDPWKKYHRVCFLTVRWPHRFVPWPDVQGVFWAEKLLLKGHTEKTFVYSFWGVIPPHILLLNDADFFSLWCCPLSVTRWVCNLPTSWANCFCWGSVTGWPDHQSRDILDGKRNPKSCLGLCKDWCKSNRCQGHIIIPLKVLTTIRALLGVQEPALPLFQWSTKKKSANTWGRETPPLVETPVPYLHF